MKKHLIFGAVLLAVLAVSCNKADIPASEPEAKGVPMTLTVTIVSADTKVDVVDDETNKVLKCNWKIGDQVSVISLGSVNGVWTNDIFEATATGKTASFSGTFTGGTPDKVVVLYPALTKGAGTASDMWYSPTYNGDYNPKGLLRGMYSGDDYVEFFTNYYLQQSLNSAADLEKYLLMAGEADLSDLSTDKLTVSLVHKMSVLKANLTFKTPDKVLRYVNVTAVKSDDSTFPFVQNGFCLVKDITSSFDTNTKINNIKMCTGTTIDGGNGSGLTVSGSSATVYIPFAPASDTPGQVTFASGDKMVVQAHYNGYPSSSKEFTFTSDKTLREGRLYTIDVVFE